MSDERRPPAFDDEFWRTVEQRAARVRQFVRDEIEQAEQGAFSEAETLKQPAMVPDGELVPVFTEPFWEEVHRRAQRVRALAVEGLAAAEERLLEDAGAESEVVTTAPARVGALSRLGRTFNLQRSDAFGFVAALLAAVLLIPQLIVPVWSSAGVEPPKILRFVLIGDRDNGEQEQSSSSEGEQGATEGAESRNVGSSNGSSTAAESGGSAAGGAEFTTNAPSGSTGASQDGTDQGAAGSAQQGADGATVQPSPSPAPSPTSAPPVVSPPAAPLDVHAVAVDSTSIRIVWTDASPDEVGFQVERRVADGAPRSTARTGKDVSSYLWTNLTPETRTCFRVRAIGDAGFSEWAPAAAPGHACATTAAAPVEAPQQPGPVQPQAPAPQPSQAAPPA